MNYKNGKKSDPHRLSILLYQILVFTIHGKI